MVRTRSKALVAAAVAAVVALAVVLVLVFMGGGHSKSYHFGYAEGQQLATETPQQMVQDIGGGQLYSPQTVTLTCQLALTSEKKFLTTAPGATLSDASATISNVRDLSGSDYVNGCRAGVLSQFHP